MIPVYIPQVDQDEIEIVTKALREGWISSEGPYISEFENGFAKYLDVSQAIAVTNGTAALEVALYALNLKEGDEVIMPSFTIISCAIAVVRLGLRPVLVDINSVNWGMDISAIENKISNRTKAIMAVHMYGLPLDMDQILSIAKKHSLYVIEDAAQVHGAEYKGKKAGSLADIGCFSFYANKILTTGEGGMVVTNNETFAKRAREYRNLCFQAKRRFFHEDIGYNFRMTCMQAALGIAQLKKIQKNIDLKIKNGRLYHKYLSEIPGLKLQSEVPYATNVYWMYCVELDSTKHPTAEEVMIKLNASGVGTRPFFLGLHEQPAFHKKGLFLNEHYPLTETAAKYGLYLPSSLDLNEQIIKLIVEKFKDSLLPN